MFKKYLTKSIAMFMTLATLLSLLPAIGHPALSAAAKLSGTVAEQSFANVDLTAEGNIDWAVWGYNSAGTSTSLSPDVRRAGGFAISDLTEIDADMDDELRGLGQFGINHTFSWTDGAGIPSASWVNCGIQQEVLGLEAGNGFSFTVPADTTEKKLTVYTAAHLGDGELTATLSDGSAPELKIDQVTNASNSPAKFIINYAAGSDGQTLTVSFTIKTAYDICANAQIYAVALSNNPPAATGLSITGTPEVGQTLTGHYTYADENNDIEGTSTFQWYRADDAFGTNKTPIPGAAGLSYTLAAADEAKYITFGVTPVAQTGAAAGAEASCSVGSVAAMPPVPFNVGNALYYADTNDSLSGPQITQQVDNITMEAWVKADAYTATGSFIRVIYNGNSGNSGYGIYLYVISATQAVPCILIGGVGTPGPAVNLNVSSWYHLVAVRESGAWSMYINGVKYALGNSMQPNPISVSDTFSIGNSALGENFIGRIDDVRFWTVARTAQQIQDNMNIKLQGNETGLLAYYNFDQTGIIPGGDNTSVTTVTDVAGGDQNLTLSGFAKNGTVSNFVQSVQWGAFAIENATYSVAEDAGSITVPIVRTGDSDGSITLNYATANGTALAGTNYTAVSGSVTFASSETRKEITIPVLDNDIATSKAFTFSVSAQQGVTLDTASAAITITRANNLPAAGFGKALSLNGTDELIIVPNVPSTRLSGSSDFTVSMWVYPIDFAGGNTTLYRQQLSGTGTLGIWLYTNGTNLKIGLDDGNPSGAWQWLSGTAVLKAGQWNHVVLTKSGNSIKTYLDGAADISAMVDTAHMAAAASTNQITVGGDNIDGRKLHGYIDEVQLYNTALDQSTIQNWMYHEADMTHPNDANLVFYYKFNDSNAAAATDFKGASNGTLQNMDAGNYVPSTIKNWTTAEDTPLTGYLVGSDEDGAAALTYEIVTNGTKGTAAIDSGNQFTYTPSLNMTGADSITYQVKDAENAVSGTQTVSISITAVNDPPVVVINSGLTINRNDPATSLKTHLSYSDPESDTITYTVTTAPARGALYNTHTNAAVGVLGTFTQADVDAGYITYTPSAGESGSDSFGFSVTDGTAVIMGQTFGISISFVNHAPVIATTGGSTAYHESADSNPASIAVDAGLTVSDTDNAALASAEVAITGNFYAGQDVLWCVNTDASLYGNISATYNSGTGVLTLVSSGATATVAQWQAALRAIKYSNTSDDPSEATRTLSFTIYDGFDGSIPVVKSITVTAVNDPPALTAATSAQVFTEGGTAVPLFSSTAVNTVESGQSITTLTLDVTNVVDDSPGDCKEFLNIDGTKVPLSNGTSVTTAVNGLSCSVTVSGSTASVTLYKSSGVSAAVMQSVIDGMTYQNDSQYPSIEMERTVTLTSIKDEGGTANSGADTAGLTIDTTVMIVAVNDTPTDITLSRSSVYVADTGVSADIGSLGTIDADTGDAFVYTLVAGAGDTDNALFHISGESLRTNAALPAGTYSVRVQTKDPADALLEKAFNITVSNKTAIILAADTTNNSVDNDIELTFTSGADPALASEVNGVSFNGHALTAAQYTVYSDKITLHPGCADNTYLRTPGTANVVITADGYDTASVSQTITAGAVETLEMTTQPVPGAETGDVFAAQPVITLKDQYGNICAEGPSATAIVTATAAAGTGSWTLGGTASIAAVNGIADFGSSSLTCTLVSSGTGMITFTSGAKSVASSTFTIPERDSAIAPASAVFDKNTGSAGCKDIVVTLTLNGNTLVGIKNGANALTADTHYTLSGSTCTIKKEYLRTLTAGTVQLTFDFNIGVNPVLQVTISDSTPEPTVTGGTTNTVVVVNGQRQDAGTSTTQTVGGQTVTTITVDDAKLNSVLEKSGDSPTVTLPANKGSDVVIGQLNGQTVKNMEQKEAVLEIRTDTVTYTLPASQINIDAVSDQIGSQVALKDIKVSVQIAEPPANTVKIVEDTANNHNYQVVVKPVQFEITCTSGSKTVEVSRFNGYVERRVAIPDGVDPSKITTGVVLNSDGTFRHVPTAVTMIDGKYYAKINSLTNSTYSVIWNPVEFGDVARHWAKDAVNDMGARLVVTGVDSAHFEPDRSVTRAEFSAMIVRALGLQPGLGLNTFNDIKSTDWFCGYIETAVAYNLIEGFSDGTFRPDDNITREQAMAVMARAMAVTRLNPNLADGEVRALLGVYADCQSVSVWAVSGAASCLKAGIVGGRTSTTINPKDTMTRAEAAVMLQRLLQKSDLI